MSTTQRGFLERRGAAALLLGLFVAGGVVFVFAGTLTRATELEAAAARARADVAALEERVALGVAEIEFIKTDTFVNQAARSVGLGGEGEVLFRLPAGAPEPAAVPPLGSEVADAAELPPLDAWLELLFES
jgi:hypothetical protein